MASYIDLVEAVANSRELYLRRREAVKVKIGEGDKSFATVLSRSLNRIGSTNVVQSSANRSALSQEESAKAEEEAKFTEGLKFVLEKEGSRYVLEDGGKESSRYGILQSTARYYGYKGDIRNISKSEVEAIYRKIWEKSGAKNLPVPLSLVHFDSYVNSPVMANKLLKKCQGNPEVYLQLREQRYTRLAQLRPETYGRYLKGWRNRISSLRNMLANEVTMKGIAGSAEYGIRGYKKETT